MNTSSREEINWVKRNNPTIHKQQQCWYCGEQNRHSWQNCPAYGQICTTCGGGNHFAKMCRATLPRSNLRAERPNRTKQINQRNMRSNRYSQQLSMYNHHNRNQYCKSLIFSVPLYLANLANLTFSLIFKDAKLKRRQQYFSTLK